MSAATVDIDATEVKAVRILAQHMRLTDRVFDVTGGQHGLRSVYHLKSGWTRLIRQDGRWDYVPTNETITVVRQFEPGDIVRGFTDTAQPISSATVLEVRGDRLLLDIWHGASHAIGVTEVYASHVGHTPRLMVTESNGDQTVTRIDQ